MITLSPFLKLHKYNLKSLTKSQVIDQVLIGIDMYAHETLSLEKTLADTQEALRRCRNLLASEKELNWRLVKQIKEYDENK